MKQLLSMHEGHPMITIAHHEPMYPFKYTKGFPLKYTKDFRFKYTKDFPFKYTKGNKKCNSIFIIC